MQRLLGPATYGVRRLMYIAFPSFPRIVWQIHSTVILARITGSAFECPSPSAQSGRDFRHQKSKSSEFPKLFY